DIAELSPAVVTDMATDLHGAGRYRAVGKLETVACPRRACPRRAQGEGPGSEGSRADLHNSARFEIDPLKIGNRQQGVAAVLLNSAGNIFGKGRQFNISGQFQQPLEGKNRKKAQEQGPPRSRLQSVSEFMIAQCLKLVELPILGVFGNLGRSRIQLS